MTDKTVKAAEANTSNVSSVSNVGETGKVFGYEAILGELGNMNKEFMDSLESKVTTKLEEVSKRLEEVSKELKKHEEDEAKRREEDDETHKEEDDESPKKEETDAMKGTTGVPYKRKPAGTKLEDDDEGRRQEAKVVYRPVFITRPSGAKAGLTMSEEELKRRKEERAKKLEEIKHKMEERRKKLAYEAARAPQAQGKAEVQSTTDTPPNDSQNLVPNPLSSSLPKVEAWMADILKAQRESDKRVVG